MPQSTDRKDDRFRTLCIKIFRLLLILSLSLSPWLLQYREVAAAIPTETDHTPLETNDELYVDWIIQLGTPQNDWATGIGVSDVTGLVTLVGNTTGNLLGTNQGSVDAWYAQYALADRAPDAALQFGDASNDQVADVAVSSGDGDVIMTGFTGLTQYWVRTVTATDEENETIVYPADPSRGLAVAYVRNTDEYIVGGAAGVSMDGDLFSNRQAWLRKHNAEDEPLWTNQFKVTAGLNGVEPFSLSLNDIAVNSLGSAVYAVGKQTVPNDTTGDTYAYVKAARVIDGENEIEQLYGDPIGSTPSNTISQPEAKAVTRCGFDICIGGETYYDAEDVERQARRLWIMAIDSAAPHLKSWTYSLLSSEEQRLSDIVECSVGPARILCAAVQIGGVPTILALDEDGGLIFQEAVGPVGMSIDSMTVDEDGAIYVAGTVRLDLDGAGSGQYAGGDDAFAMKLRRTSQSGAGVIIESATGEISVNGQPLSPGSSRPLMAEDSIQAEAPSVFRLNRVCDTETTSIISAQVQGPASKGNTDASNVEFSLNSVDESVVCDQDLWRGGTANAEDPTPLTLLLESGGLSNLMHGDSLPVQILTEAAVVRPAASGQFAVAHSTETDESTLTAYRGDLTIVPANTDLNPFDLIEGHWITVSQEEVGLVSRLLRTYLPAAWRALVSPISF